MAAFVRASQKDGLRVVGGGSAVGSGVTGGGLMGGMTGVVSGTTGTAQSTR